MFFSNEPCSSVFKQGLSYPGMVVLCTKLRANDLLHLTSVGLRYDLPLLVMAVQTVFKRRYPRTHRWSLRVVGDGWLLKDWSIWECNAPTLWMSRARPPPNQSDQNDNELLDDSDDEMEDVDDEDTGDENDTIINVRFRIIRDRQSFLLWTPFDLRRQHMPQVMSSPYLKIQQQISQIF